jgi:hypothetical protein
MELVRSRALSLLGSVLFFGCANFAAAGTPSITGPYYDDNGNFQLSPFLPDAPYFLNDIWMKKDNGAWQPLQVGYRDYAVTVNLSAPGNYAFKTRWYNPNPQPGTYSEFSNSIVVAVSAVAAPDMPTINVPASDTDGNYVVSWGNAPRADQYKLEQAINGGGWSIIQSGSTTSYTASNQTTGTYSYRVSACNVTGCTLSNASSINVTTTNVPIPGVPSPSRVPNVTVITWSAVANASYYETDIYQNGWIRIASGSGTSAWYGGYSPQQFRVRACNVNAACSAYAYLY